MLKIGAKGAIFSVSMSLFGCASIVSNSMYPVTIDSVPNGANFVVQNIDGQIMHRGTTPSTVTLKSGNGYFTGATYNITFEVAGGQKKEVTLDSSLNGWYFGNILFGGLIGMLIVDPITGAMWKLPETVVANFGLNTSELGDTGPQLRIVSLNDVPEEMRQKMIQIRSFD